MEEIVLNHLCTMYGMNSMKLVIPLHFALWKKTPNDAVTQQCQIQFTPKTKANVVPRLLSSLVWIDQYNETCHSVTFYFTRKTPNDAVTPQHQSQFTPKMKANAEPRLLSSLVWIDRYNECNGMTSFMEFMKLKKKVNNFNCFIDSLRIQGFGRNGL